MIAIQELAHTDLAAGLAAAEYAYRAAMMRPLRQADDVEPLACVAEHLASMTAVVHNAAVAALERVDLCVFLVRV